MGPSLPKTIKNKMASADLIFDQSEFESRLAESITTFEVETPTMTETSDETTEMTFETTTMSEMEVTTRLTEAVREAVEEESEEEEEVVEEEAVEEEVVEEVAEAPVEAVEMRSQSPKLPKINAIEAAFKRHLSDAVVDLIYWRDIKKSACVAASSLILLISLSIFSVLSVISYISLAVLTVTFSFAVYKRTLAAVQKSNEGHPFSQYLEMDLSISPEKAQEYAEIISSYMATYVGELRRLALVEDMIDSIKFGIFLWVMTYVGAWFNGLTLLILGLVSMFSLPKTYEVYQEQIDAYLALAQDQVKGIMAQNHLPKIMMEKVVDNASYYRDVIRKQLPKDFDEAKEMAVKLYNNVVELIHAKIPIGKKDQ